MASMIRVLGLVLALLLAICTVLALQIGPHDGITPIHATKIDVGLMLVGMFLLFAAIITVALEAFIVMLRRPRAIRADSRIPRARVVVRAS